MSSHCAWCTILELVSAAVLATGCSTGGSPSQAPATTVPTTAASASAPVAAGTPTSTVTPATTAVPPRTDALTFFRAQEVGCRAHAEKVGNAVLESERFTRAKEVRDLGDGGYLVEDGVGDRLVVRPADGVVLPESGRATDVLPLAYSYGCPEDVFVGASHD